MSSPVTSKPTSPNPHPSVNLLLLITGSIATVKTGLLLDQLSTEHCTIRIGATNSAFHFLKRAQPSKTGIPFKSIITDEEEWKTWQAMDDVVIHIALRKWADLVLIAPLDANSLGKLANGLCDNLVTLVMRAWELKEKPVIICPAMNSAMWMHPVTTKHIDTLREWYMGSIDHSNNANNHNSCDKDSNNISKHDVSENTFHLSAELPESFEQALFQIVGPIKKQLACGDIGTGGMASVEEIAKVVRHTMQLIRAKKVREQHAQEQKQERANDDGEKEINLRRSSEVVMLESSNLV